MKSNRKKLPIDRKKHPVSLLSSTVDDLVMEPRSPEFDRIFDEAILHLRAKRFSSVEEIVSAIVEEISGQKDQATGEFREERLFLKMILQDNDAITDRLKKIWKV